MSDLKTFSESAVKLSRNPLGEIKFHLDQAMLQQLQNTQGFVPVITKIQPADLRVFFGLVKNQSTAQTI